MSVIHRQACLILRPTLLVGILLIFYLYPSTVQTSKDISLSQCSTFLFFCRWFKKMKKNTRKWLQHMCYMFVPWRHSFLSLEQLLRFEWIKFQPIFLDILQFQDSLKFPSHVSIKRFWTFDFLKKKFVFLDF